MARLLETVHDYSADGAAPCSPWSGSCEGRAASVIDAHHHVWDLRVRDQDWITGPAMAPIRRSFSLDDLRPSARAAGVMATVLVQTVTVAAETPELLAVAAATRWWPASSAGPT